MSKHAEVNLDRIFGKDDLADWMAAQADALHAERVAEGGDDDLDQEEGGR